VTLPATEVYIDCWTNLFFKINYFSISHPRYYMSEPHIVHGPDQPASQHPGHTGDIRRRRMCSHLYLFGSSTLASPCYEQWVQPWLHSICALCSLLFCLVCSSRSASSVYTYQPFRRILSVLNAFCPPGRNCKLFTGQGRD
jgi:hypothetical protein